MEMLCEVPMEWIIRRPGPATKCPDTRDAITASASIFISRQRFRAVWKDRRDGPWTSERTRGQVAGSGVAASRLRTTCYSNRDPTAACSHGGQREGSQAGSNKIAATSSSLSATMSLSPTTSNEYEPTTGKRRRTSFSISSQRSEMAHSPQEASSAQGISPTSPAHIPKRGARACTACRKGKNRCEGEPALSARPGLHRHLVDVAN